MLDPDLKNHLEIIEEELMAIRNDSTRLSASFKKGVVYGAGYITGAVLVIVIIGWVLNILGIIPAFNNQLQEFRSALERIGGPIK